MTDLVDLQQAFRFLLDGNLTEAEKICNWVLKKFPAQPDALHYLGLIFSEKGEINQAMSFLKKSLQVNPFNLDCNYNLAMIFQNNGNLEEAVTYFRKITDLNPHLSEIHFALANNLVAMGRTEEAVYSLEKVISLNPSMAEAHYNLGVFHFENKNFREAEKYFRKTVELMPEWAEANNNLGNILKGLTNINEAMYYYYQAAKYKPDWADIYNNIGGLLIEQGNLTEAIKNLKKAIELNPDDYSKRYTVLLALQYSSDLSQQEWKKELALFSKACSVLPKVKNYNLQINPKKKLRIGYVSPDFCKHSCGWFIEPLLLSHNHNKFEIYCFSLTSSQDSMTEKLKQLADEWFDINGLADNEIVELILKNKIDILVDLSGHTGNNRLSVFAMKPAPVQVTWLGSPGSTGLDAIDYRISDEFLTPENGSEYYSEKVWNLGRLSHSYKSPEESPEIGPPPFLKNGYLTFGSFNAFIKISDIAFKLWSGVLNKVPGSRMIIKVRHGEDDAIKSRIFSSFNQYRIDKKRIDVYSSTQTIKDHLDFYNKIDISLDTFPYNGATTTLESLWMGVPVITLIGDRTASRYSFSFLSSLNLAELASHTIENYFNIAFELASKPKELINFRKNLRRMITGSQINDWQGFAHDLEAAYRKMWEKWCLSQKNTRNI